MKKQSIFRKRTRRSTRRNKKKLRTRGKRSSTSKINPKSTNRTEEEFIRKVTNEIRQGTDTKGTRKRTSLGLRLSPKLRKIGQEEVLTRRGDNSRGRLKLTHPTNCRPGNQEENFTRKIPKRARGQRSKGGPLRKERTQERSQGGTLEEEIGRSRQKERRSRRTK